MTRNAAAAIVADPAPPPAPTGEVHYFWNEAAWHELRAQDVTASTLAGHFGFSRWSSAYSDYVEKAGLAERAKGDSMAMRAGRHMEHAIALMVAEQEGWNLLTGSQFRAVNYLDGGADPLGMYLRDPVTRLGATPDRVLVESATMARPVEIKNVSWQAWRDEWEDGQAPVKYWLQGQIQAGIARAAGLDWGGPIIVALVAGNDLKILPYEFDAEAFAMCQERTRAFWADVAAGREPVPDINDKATREAIRRRYARSQENSIDLSASDEALQVAQSLAEARARKTAAEKEADLLSAHLLNMIGHHAHAKLAAGWEVNAKTSERKGFTVEASTVRAIRVGAAKEPAKAKAPKPKPTTQPQEQAA